MTPAEFRDEYGIDARVHHEVTEIDLKSRRVLVTSLEEHKEWWEAFDHLLIATGAVPILPAVPGSDARGVYGLHSLQSGIMARNVKEEVFLVDSGEIELVDLFIPEGVHHPPASTLELANLLDVRQGERVLDLGCGAGLLAIAAARRGAGCVMATDINPRAIDATMKNAQANGVAEKITVRRGSWYEALQDYSIRDKGYFDVIIATPPQTPGPCPFGPRYGGPDGTKHLSSILQGAPAFLNPDRGRLWLMAISLANPSELLRLLRKHFHHVSVVLETERPFTSNEYESLHKGLIHHLLKLRSSGHSDFKDVSEGTYEFRNLFIRAWKARAP